MLYLTKQIRIESTRSHDILRTRGRLRKKRRLSFALKITEFHPLWATFLLLLLLLCTSRRELALLTSILGKKIGRKPSYDILIHSSGGWSWSNSEEDDSKERVSLWRRSEKEGRSWFYPRFELSLKKRRGKEDGLARFSRIYGSSGLHNIDPSTSSPQKGQACRRRIVLGNSSSSRPRMRRFSIISLLDRARHPFNFTFGRGTIVSRARSFNHPTFEQK